MDAGVAPEWVSQFLPVVLWGAAIAGAVWLVFVGLDYLNRRDYNLTVADRGGSGGKPDFLAVDHEKREAARRAGEALDARLEARDRAEADAAGPAAAKARRALTLASIATAFFAAVTVATAAIGAIGRIEYYDEAVRRLSNWERLVEIISAYWLGFLVVALMVAAQIYYAIRQARSG